jgi:hypothetical protein
MGSEASTEEASMETPTLAAPTIVAPLLVSRVSGECRLVPLPDAPGAFSCAEQAIIIGKSKLAHLIAACLSGS